MERCYTISRSGEVDGDSLALTSNYLPQSWFGEKWDVSNSSFLSFGGSFPLP